MTELLVVLFVVVLVFGAAKIPALGDAIGRAVRGARASSRGDGGEPGSPDDRSGTG